MLKLVKIEENKNIDILNKINEFKNPTYIYLPVLNTNYKIGDYLYKNTYINNYISSVSGVIKEIKKVVINNKLQDAYVIENDYKENSKLKRKNLKISSKEELVNILNEYHLTEVEEKITKLNNITNLVISSIDEECYSANEFIRLSTNYSEILETIDNLINIFKVKEATLAAKNTNFKSIKNVKSILGTYPNICLNLVPDKHLISKDKFLCEYLNIPLNETLVITTNEIYDIYNILKKGKEKIDKLLTISGNAIKKSLIINVRLNTKLDEILKEYIKITEDNYKVYINGFLSGIELINYQDLVITKDIDVIVINKSIEEETACINCGACIKICPHNINVKKCYFNKCSSSKCIGCGLCNYICPAKIDLKKIVREDNHEK